MDGFIPRFRHFVALLIGCAVNAAIAEFIAPADSKARIVFYVLSGSCFLIGWWFISALLSGARHRQIIERQDAARSDIEALTRFARTINQDLPPAAVLQALGRIMPKYGLELIEIMPEVVIQDNSDGAVMQYEIPAGLASPAQLAALAREYFDNRSGLPVRYFTEGGEHRNKIFSRPQFERLLSELLRARVAERDVISREVDLTDIGRTWLYRHYKPAATSPLSDLTPLRNAA